MEIAAARVNYFARIKAGDKAAFDIKQFYTEAVSFFSLFKKQLNCRIARLAAVRSVYAIHDNPGVFLARHFCKEIWDEAPLNRPENFELHEHKRYPLSEDISGL